MIRPSARRRAGRPSGRGAALAVALSALAAGAAVSCAPAPPLVGLFLYERADPYIDEFARQIEEEARGGLSVVAFDAGNSQLIQNEQLLSFLSKKPAAVMLNPVDRLASYALARRLKEAGVPVVFFNREPLARDLEIWERSYYVGARAEQSGQMQAELAMALFGGDPAGLNRRDLNGDGAIQLLILKGEQGHQDAELRTKALLESFDAAGYEVEVLAIEVANWKFDEGYEKIGPLARAFGGRIELIASNNDAMALGAIARLRQLGYFKDDNRDGAVDGRDGSWLPVLGIDGLKEAQDSIREGYLYGTVKNDSLSMARAMVRLAVSLVAPEPPPNRPLAERYIWIDYQPFKAAD